MICPKCGDEFVDGIETCSECGVQLVHSIEDGTFAVHPPQQGIMRNDQGDKLIRINRMGPFEEAKLVEGFLQAKGIYCEVMDKSLGSPYPGLVVSYDLLIHPGDEKLVRDLLQELESETQHED